MARFRSKAPLREVAFRRVDEYGVEMETLVCGHELPNHQRNRAQARRCDACLSAPKPIQRPAWDVSAQEARTITQNRSMIRRSLRCPLHTLHAG